MGQRIKRIVVGLFSALLIIHAGSIVGSSAGAAAVSAPAHTASSVAQTAPVLTRSKQRCVLLTKRTGTKVKQIKRCERVVTKKTKRCVIIKKYVGKKVERTKRCKKIKKAPIVIAETLPTAVVPIEPAPTESAPVEPTPTESAPSEPAPSEPAPSEPEPSEPAPSESAPTRPSAANTGVPVGTSLTVHNGDLTVTTPGAVIDGLDIRGFVSVRAPNVTIKRSIIRGGAAGTVGRGVLAITHSSATNFLVEDVTIVPTNPTPYLNGINVNQAGTVRRADISGTVDGIMIYGSGVRIEGSHLHDFRHYTNDPNWGGGGSHDDAIQVQGGTGIQIIGNTLKGAYNAGVMITQDAAVTKDLSINGNWIDGGGCSINYGSNGAYKTGMQANDNRFGRAQRNANCAIIHNALKSDLAPTGNVWDDNGAPATIKRGG
jgi:hypothetical protein